MANWKCGAARGLAIVERGSWDGAATKARIFAWAGFDGDNPSSTKARRAFLAYDAAEPDLKGSYKLPFADVVDGGLKAITAGLSAAASRLPGTDIPDSVKKSAQAVLDGYKKRTEKKSEDSMDQMTELSVMSEAILSTSYVDGMALDDKRRLELKKQLKAGELASIVFDAMVYRDGRNANYLRFRDEDLPVFAESFGNQPFLRNHDDKHIESRDGTVQSSLLKGSEFIQSIKLTTEQGMTSFLEGQMDRFSIAWHKWKDVLCSVCGESWMTKECNHWPGRTYKWEGEDKLCELIFVEPKGKETSAVNAPAVDGTRVLAQLCEQKREVLSMGKETEVLETQEAVVPEVVEIPAVKAAVQPVVEKAAKLEAIKPDKWQKFLQEQGINAILVGSKLPGDMQQAIREEFEDREVEPVALQKAVERYQSVWSKLQEKNIITGLDNPLDGGRIRGMSTGMDDMQNAMNWVFGVEGATTPEPQLRRLDNLYQIITGDWDWHGTFMPDQSRLAAADAATLTGLAVNAMNKVMIPLYNSMAVYRWFEPLVTVQPHDGSTQDMQWIQYGGIANLPTVKEGAPYTELTVGDSKESDSFAKRGGYVGITLEMIRKSEIAKVRATTNALVVSSARTRSAAISYIFTQASGVGPTLDNDSVVLFHTATHGNLATTAFSWTAWKAARLECAKQTELTSGKRIGFWPKFCIVPFDLYDDALITFGYGQGAGGKPATTDKDVNPYAESRPGDPRPTVVPVPDWTDANDWAYLTDPVLNPVIQMSYAQLPGGGSHPMPEIFSVTTENSGLMFTNDVLPVKVRDWFAYGVAGYRGIGKRNV